MISRRKTPFKREKLFDVLEELWQVARKKVYKNMKNYKKWKDIACKVSNSILLKWASFFHIHQTSYRWPSDTLHGTFGSTFIQYILHMDIDNWESRKLLGRKLVLNEIEPYRKSSDQLKFLIWQTTKTRPDFGINPRE
jgi:hypothetical protein